MLGRIKVLLVFLLSILVITIHAQNGTVSPFSRYAFGELDENISACYRAMGGVRYGLRNHLALCPSQPASYTACDSLTFMMDVAAHLNVDFFKDANGQQHQFAGNLDYITIQFPIWKRALAFSFGLMPYSSVGYDFTLADSINSNYHYTVNYYGEGGITDFYVGMGANIKNWVAIGFNMYYMFGNIKNYRHLSFSESSLTNVTRTTKIQANSFRFRYGLQVFHKFGKHDVSIGLIYEHKQAMKGEYSETSTTDTLENSSRTGLSFPSVLGVGIAYHWNKRLLVAFDFERQLWSNVNFLSNFTFGSEHLKNTNKFALGIEYCHSPYGKNYAQRMMWRLGASLTHHYIRAIKQPNINVGFGFGFPFRTIGSILNISFEYTRRGNTATLVEHNIQATISATIRENWFFKRKL